SLSRVQPCYPASLMNVDVFQLRLTEQAARDLAAGITALATAVDNDAYLGQPCRQKLRKQLVPAVFVQRHSIRDMIPFQFHIWSRIYPDRISIPSARLRYGNHLGSRNRRLPRDFITKIDRLPNSGKQRKRRQNERL